MVSESLTIKAKKSVVWSLIEKISAQGVGFIISIILSRLLLPNDYGNIALLSVFIAIAQVVIDSGFSTALIQNQDRTDEDYCTAFYCNIGIGSLLYLLMYVSAPLLATFYEQELFISVLRIYGLTLIISSLSIVQKTRFMISYDFRIIATISTFSILIGGLVSIVLAYKGVGVWSLVTYYILNSIVATIGYWAFGKWMPRKGFSILAFKRIFTFGSKILSANLINVIFSNLYTLVIGRLFTPVQLGYFNRSQTIANVVPSNFSNIITQASYPVFCEMQTDKIKLKEVFLKYLDVSFYLCAPIMTILIGISSPLILLILTDKWSDSILYIQILALGYMFDPVMRLNANVMNVTGKSNYSLYSELLKKISLICILFLTVSYGIIALVGGICIYSLIDLFIGSIFVKKVINVSLFDEMIKIFPTIICCILMYISMYCVQGLFESFISKILVAILTGCIIYVLSSLLFAKKKYVFVLRTLKALKK